MRTAIVGLQKTELAEYVRKHYPQLEVVQDGADGNAEQPDIVLCYGGDGTFLYAERQYPGVVKAMIKNSATCNLCPANLRDVVLESIVNQTYAVEERWKLQAQLNNSDEQPLIAAADAIVGHAAVNRALRYAVEVNGEMVAQEVIGDGCIIATPLGATGYYNSITRMPFDEGLGVAFNNPVEPMPHHVFAEDAEVKITILRGPGLLAVDNDEQLVSLSTGDVVTVRRAPELLARLAIIPETAEETVGVEAA